MFWMIYLLSVLISWVIIRHSLKLAHKSRYTVTIIEAYDISFVMLLIFLVTPLINILFSILVFSSSLDEDTTEFLMKKLFLIRKETGK